jgi:hypothetical protein
MPQTAAKSLSRKACIYCVLIVVLFFCGYLEWGRDRGKFLFQLPAELLQTETRDAGLHPLVLGPVIGLLLLLVAAIRPRMPRLLVLLGLTTPIIVSGLILIGGIQGRKPVMVVSVLPFFIALVLLLRALRDRQA